MIFRKQECEWILALIWNTLKNFDLFHSRKWIISAKQVLYWKAVATEGCKNQVHYHISVKGIFPLSLSSLLKNLNLILYSDHLSFLEYPFIVSHPDYSCLDLPSETQFLSLVTSTLQSCLLSSVCLKQKVCSHSRDTSYFLIHSKQFLN